MGSLSLSFLSVDTRLRKAMMARYFFHTRQGDAFVPDIEGVELSPSERPEDEAAELALDLLAEGDLQGADRREWSFEIADEKGETVLTLPFIEAVEADAQRSGARADMEVL